MTTIPLIQLDENDVPGAKFTGRVVEDHSNLQLRRWLACRGLKTTGKRSDLIERCHQALLCGKKDEIIITIDGGKWYQKKVAEQTPSTSVSNILPIFGWKSFSAVSLPNLFSYGSVYHWIVESMPSLSTTSGYDSDSDDNSSSDNTNVATEKPLRRGRLYVSSGNVGSVQVKLEANKFFYKAQVLPSMRTDHYTVTTTISGISGGIIDASCHCKSSALKRCSHVAALLLFLSDHIGATDKSPACTDLPCQWNRGKKRKNPTSVHKAHYPTKRKVKQEVIKFDPRPSGTCVNSSQINRFLTNLQLGGKPGKLCMWETVLGLSYEDYNLNPTEMNVLMEKVSILRQNLSNYVSVRSSQPLMVENTTDQTLSATWEQHRYCRLTASTAKEVVNLWNAINECGKTDGVKHRLLTFLRKKVWGLDRVMTSDMIHGLKKENIARQDYETLKQETISNFNVEISGLWVHPKFPMLGCSPDGLVMDPSTLENYGLIEIKVLKIFTDYSPEEIATTSHVKGELKTILSRQCFTVTNNKLVLKTSHQYYYQVQFQLGITGRHWCDFVLWSPKGKPSVQRIERDENFIKDILSANVNLWDKVIAPEIFEMKTPRNLKPIIL